MTHIPTPQILHARLTSLRQEIGKAGLDGLIVPISDEYQNEIVPSCDRRIEFLTGFTGSFAFLIIFQDRAIFFTDSRYTLQAKEQVNGEDYTFLDIAETAPSDWLSKNITAGKKLGFDPRLHPIYQIERLETALLKFNASLVPTEDNLIDLIWTKRPARLSSKAFIYEQKYAGKESIEKRNDLAQKLQEEECAAHVITDPTIIAWLLNIRGNDVPMTPVILSKIIFYKSGDLFWFVDEEKLNDEIKKSLPAQTKLCPEGDFEKYLSALGKEEQPIYLDPYEVPYHVLSLIRQAGAKTKSADNLCLLPRACKNKTEIEGMTAAHIRDGVAVVRFLHWLDENAMDGDLTELDVEKKLEEFRAQDPLFKGPSFNTIAGAGPHGAIVHYRATEETNTPLTKDSFLLLDSGGHYMDGTTDITRTIPIGEISDEMKDAYTRVLKGMIALSKICFPDGTSGSDLDILARQYLWEAGLDYGHGTGHGVGCYLNVHEGPQSISKRSSEALKEGMVLSNEPGYYKEGAFGIRHENLQYVAPAPNLTKGRHFCFIPLTLVPFDMRGLKVSLLSPAEIDWLNSYHEIVFEVLEPHLEKTVQAWLKKKTKQLIVE